MVGVWMAPVTAQVMITLSDVAMLKPVPGPGVAVRRRPNRPMRTFK